MRNDLIGLYSTMQEVCKQLNITELSCMIRTTTEADSINFQMYFEVDNLVLEVDFNINMLENLSTEELIDYVTIKYNDKKYNRFTSSYIH